MLILPLHKPFSRGRLPWSTLLLVFLNLFVFMVLQSGDGRREAQAREDYVHSGLAAIEVPRYLDGGVLPEDPQARAFVEMMRAAPEPMRSLQLSALIDLDHRFLARLAAGDVEPPLDDVEQWRRLREAHEQALARSFTDRFKVQGGSLDPLRLVGSAFLHAGWGHLLGNLLFLVLIGLLVEGAIGSRLHFLLYVLGAAGASLFALAWRWGEPHAGLGASGAVSAMMGAFCLLWGLRRVRLFYWIGFVFDYVRAPALLLLPPWLGWELYHLLMHPELAIGFDAHAGGLLTGAAFGALMWPLGQVREDFIEAEDADGGDDGALLEEAEQALAQMDLARAERALAELAEDTPELAISARARLAGYRCARLGRRLPLAAERLAGLLQAPAGLPMTQQADLLAEAGPELPPLPPEALQAACTRLLASGRRAEVQAWLHGLPPDYAPAVQPALWLRLALAQRQGGAGNDPHASLRELLRRFPRAPEAAKARTLLGG
ncbi:MAG: rhomboid family intramembrane serine protease [Aquimonas sp.]|nr:rhomboid family intramembrane serine protease [Aquimonas sp.]